MNIVSRDPHTTDPEPQIQNRYNFEKLGSHQDQWKL